jgi:hypothetical protein
MEWVWYFAYLAVHVIAAITVGVLLARRLPSSWLAFAAGGILSTAVLLGLFIVECALWCVEYPSDDASSWLYVVGQGVVLSPFVFSAAATLGWVAHDLRKLNARTEP